MSEVAESVRPGWCIARGWLDTEWRCGYEETAQIVDSFAMSDDTDVVCHEIKG